MNVRTHYLAGLLALGLAAPSGADPFRPSVRDQIALGKRASESLRKEAELLPATDPRVVEMRRIGAALVAQIPAEERKRRPFEYSFDVVDDPQLNAFALPGGPIFFYSGLLNRLKTEDQVAGILAHEIVHIRNQHWASAFADNTKRRLGLAVVLSVFNANDTIVDIASITDTVVMTLGYSRRHETEADRVGYDMALAAGYNPRGMVEVFEVFRQSGGRLPEFLSTHPDTEKRIVALQKRLDGEARPLPEPRERSEEVRLVSERDAERQRNRREPAKGKGLRSAAAKRACWCPGHGDSASALARVTP